MRKIGFLLIPLIVFGTLAITWNLFGAPGNSTQTQVFIVPRDDASFDSMTALENQKFIKSAKAFSFIINNFGGGSGILPGGYNLSQNMNAWQVMKKLTGKADLLWFKSSFCIRKEQVGEYLGETFGWDASQLSSWNSLYKNTDTDYYEGVYYPDTYLIPVNEVPKEVAQRFINNFNEKLAPLTEGFAQKNIKWTTGLKIASLIAREAAGKDDMKIISGIIWNRLNTGMPLQIDATMQYTLGKNANGSWWGSIDLTQKKSDSPYNSYKTKGLPPTPICSPNIDAIEAALNPAETDCIFYLHDSNKQIHCAKTYKEHLENIKKYL